MRDHIDSFLSLFPKLTKEEADYIENIINWSEEKRMAFKFAKRLFEEDTAKKKKGKK